MKDMVKRFKTFCEKQFYVSYSSALDRVRNSCTTFRDRTIIDQKLRFIDRKYELLMVLDFLSDNFNFSKPEYDELEEFVNELMESYKQSFMDLVFAEE